MRGELDKRGGEDATTVPRVLLDSGGQLVGRRAVDGRGWISRDVAGQESSSRIRRRRDLDGEQETAPSEDTSITGNEEEEEKEEGRCDLWDTIKHRLHLRSVAEDVGDDPQLHWMSTVSNEQG
ncbi:hypothetical protein CRG98_050347 [Punica granatum]|uniref:Uncharacterized protein n=1 Tax=Punica granatum TaxID=22663 RepID=A0A2I0GDD9_PUNGR|nr:hypothetical protein CRG98_050347 [Punica granatum]